MLELTIKTLLSFVSATVTSVFRFWGRAGFTAMAKDFQLHPKWQTKISL